MNKLHFLSFLNERIETASSKETQSAYTIVLDRFKKLKVFDKTDMKNAFDTGFASGKAETENRLIDNVQYVKQFPEFIQEYIDFLNKAT